ncbi:MAG: ABC transporter permease/substrate-binding protein [Deltaproteobacteria bacterium]|nr:ABC transporter permease/substrate-binding protein [Deltaproteobacteria bacterium]
MSADAWTSQLALLPDYGGSHVLLTLGALCLGIALSLPTALLVVRVRPLATPVLAVASVIQTIPGLALLALMVPLLGRIGVAPALLALVLYSALPILRNTVTGVLSVDANVLEAARGIGMTETQTLLRVQLPLAMPVIVAGVRTAAVWTVGMATLSTPVGATSLGNYIFSGLQTQNMAAVLVGCGAAAGLAIVLDAGIRLAEVALRRRHPLLGGLAALGLVALLLLGAAPSLIALRADDGRPVARIGAKTFTEQYILAELMALRLREAGFRVENRDSLGSTVIFDALVSDEIDAYVDYSGTIWANHMKRKDAPGAERVLAELEKWLDEEHGVLLLGALGFENAYALAMRRDHANSLGVRDIDELAAHARKLSMGADYEFFARPEWTALRDAYSLRFREQRSFDSALMYSAVADGHVDVISAFSTDGRIAAFDLVVLDGPREALPPYDAVVLVSPRARKSPELLAALEPLVQKITNEDMRGANKRVDLDGESTSTVAETLSAGLRR